jgi:serine/threonine protein phosphatase 1
MNIFMDLMTANKDWGDTMNKVFVIGDIHGKHAMFEAMLKHWNPDNQQLVLLGDLIDRGEDAYSVIHLAQKLKEEFGAIVLKANHEDLFLNWLEMPYSNMNIYYSNGGRETIHSFFNKPVTYSYDPLHLANLIEEQFSHEIEFIKNLPLYYEWNNHLFVHAGVNLDLKDWRNTNEEDFLWIREPFHYGKNDTGKIIVFGHTPTFLLNKDKSPDIWISPCKTKIGIDGGAVYGGLLHGLLIEDTDTYTVFSIHQDKNCTIRTLSLSEEKHNVF